MNGRNCQKVSPRPAARRPCQPAMMVRGNRRASDEKVGKAAASPSPPSAHCVPGLVARLPEPPSSADLSPSIRRLTSRTVSPSARAGKRESHAVLEHRLGKSDHVVEDGCITPVDEGAERRHASISAWLAVDRTPGDRGCELRPGIVRARRATRFRIASTQTRDRQSAGPAAGWSARRRGRGPAPPELRSRRWSRTACAAPPPDPGRGRRSAARNGPAGLRGEGRCPPARADSGREHMKRRREVGGGRRQRVTWCSCIACRRADWVRGLARLISSAIRSCVKTAPARNGSCGCRRWRCP